MMPLSSIVNTASFEDSGEKAMNEVFTMSLGDLVAGFLSECDWKPKPATWSNLE